MTLEQAIAERHQRARQVAFSYYIRKGFVPPALNEIIAATVSVKAFHKF